MKIKVIWAISVISVINMTKIMINGMGAIRAIRNETK
jgi:hypothetical protein